MTKKLTFEEVARRVKEFNPDYELIEYIMSKNTTLKYLPTGEEFKCYLGRFLKGSSHAPSIAKKVKLEKRKKTCLEKYGAENVSQTKEVQNKMKKTNLDKYGVENPFQTKEVQNKKKKTTLERYGVEYSQQSKTVIDKIKKTRIENGYTKSIEGKTISQISTEKEMSRSHLNFLERKGVDIVNFNKSKGSSIELLIKSILEQLGLEFEREKWFNGNKIRVDFYVPKFKLIIEANGIYWHSDKVKEKDYHYNRRKTLNELGLKVIQFNEIEIIEDPIRVKYMIKDFIETGGRESYIYEEDYLIVNLDYSIPPSNFKLIEEWIGEYEMEGHKIYNSGMQKLKRL